MINPKISIIVPVYNAENYLDECIHSILRQTYSNIELVLVNDGSHDNSHDICERYSQKENVKYLLKENGGASSARNAGLDKASGEYIMFVDADDFIDQNMVESLYVALNTHKAQVSCCGFKKYFDKDHIVNYAVIETKGLNEEETHNIIFNELIGGRGCGSPVCKLYDFSIIRKNHIRFNENISNNEDVLFNMAFFKITSRAVVLDIHPYYYRKGQDSLSSGYIKKWKDLYLKIYEEKEYILGEELCSSKKNLLQHCWFLLNLIGLINELQAGKKEKAKGVRFANISLYIDNIQKIENRRSVIFSAFNYPDRRANFRKMYPVFAYVPIWMIKLACRIILSLYR